MAVSVERCVRESERATASLVYHDALKLRGSNDRSEGIV